MYPTSQFHYGSITTKKEKEHTKEKNKVSIPLWFDYNLEFLVYYLEKNDSWSQFHYGSITTEITVVT